MALHLTVYTFEDDSGSEFGSYTTQDYQEAKRYAAQNHLRVIGNEYEYSERVELEDYTPGTDDDETDDE